MPGFASDLLADRVVWLTGGASGIGLGIAHALVAHGATVVLTGRKADRLAAAVEALGPKSFAAPGDVRDADAMVRIATDVVATHGKLDALVNGAAGNFLAPAAQLSPNGFGTVIDIDLKGTFHCTRAAFPHLLQSRGSVLSISATLHYGGTPWQAHCVAAKAGIDALTRTLAVEWGPFGIRVNSVAPGPIGGTEGLSRLAPGLADQVANQLPMRRLGTVDDVAHASLFLLSDLAAWVTGSVVVVDGGGWLANASHLLRMEP